METNALDNTLYESWKIYGHSKKTYVDFGPCLGERLNFTEMLNESVASVQTLHFASRDDIANAIDEYVKQQNQSLYEATAKNNTSGLGISYDLSQAIAGLPRQTDVNTFWNEDACNNFCALRNRMADAVASMPQRYNLSITVSTRVVGHKRKRGRKHAHPNYIKALLSTKIIVLAQRDRWEDHFRLDEALLSGALVMTDPQLIYPHGIIVDGDHQNIVVYHSILEMEIKIRYYLNPRNEEERIQIGQRGRELALTHHRIWQLAERLLLNDMTYRDEYGVSNKPW